jgi:hypothetical protein
MGWGSIVHSPPNNVDVRVPGQKHIFSKAQCVVAEVDAIQLSCCFCVAQTLTRAALLSVTNISS